MHTSLRRQRRRAALLAHAAALVQFQQQIHVVGRRVKHLFAILFLEVAVLLGQLESAPSG